MKKILRKHKAFYTRIYRLAKACDMSFDFALQMIKLRADDKQLMRKKRSHGSFLNWDTASMDTLGLMVCECSKKDGETIKIRVFMTKEELPIEQQFLWEESTMH
ncbi:hypothetical protein FGD67_01590 [Colwellia sp. M166]|uniref:hypothetical protein n=1 Tax=Colwellia sp. M166 TaxID=2583805 RepID=UPI00211DEB3E|nr:hypothetical protein [Colwellia sp. M166]UUO22033.1 hypothetical protein FGD67_01590 [Colwellia sp. M166]|tara:strand:- start:77 stop:388 length:312 start_codon:yes stop_codon:yes gene_type:complete